jgi:hypothetical protein
VVVSVDSGSTSGQKRAAKPGDDAARRDLVRSLQTEMRRVGCYEGELSGQWTPGTKRAMGAFVARLNASLPVEEPDYILLALARSQPASVCGKGCPADQGLADDGRCVPKAILAQQAARKGRPPAIVAVPRTSPAPVSASVAEAPSVVVQPAAVQPLPGRMAIGAPADTPPPSGSVVVTPSAGAPEAVTETAPPSATVAGPRPPEVKKPKEAKEPARERPHLRSTPGTRAVVDIFTNPLGRN